jgi:hypothetical protein
MSEINCDVRVDPTDVCTRELDTSYIVVDELNFSVFTIFQNLSIWKLQ